ncbi:hypothetical protein SDC9_140318 [bioreactor metagenome]|uniref:Uncharacterized protein n=1 Tax=bioreactor metagenome TaxID=1076179 RepID=A0A645DXX1_9ZZZZ
MNLVPGKGMVKFGPLFEQGYELLAEGDGSSELSLTLENPVTHTLKLWAGEVPLVCKVLLLEILFDG